MMNLLLEDWLAWSAEKMDFALDSRHDLSQREGPEPPLPAMLRRRLDSTGRAVCDALSLLDPAHQYPVVHASRHGDVKSSLAMLQALAEQQPLSPAKFSMSVHNAVLGVHSISRKNTRSMQALAACGHELDAMLLEAAGYLLEGHAAVLAVFSDSDLPAAYQQQSAGPEAAACVALRLSRDRGRALQASAGEAPAQPAPLDVARWLAHGGELQARQRWSLA
ncbi:beta-ketoacyl synthase chain length factor [Halopseudomonas sabulinigri]|uniref:Beta-ketoacyl synthase-like N-terminal domain-containing protein n=1 Tax=Halopseudomonas sabulinigri TaxID=472181 RepID=A0ABP9ZUC7_9GAMM